MGILRSTTVFAIALLAACLVAACGGGGKDCKETSDCPPGRYCQVSNGICAYDCVQDAECPAGYRCDLHGQCLSGCREGTHDGGDGQCVTIGTCSSGYHDGGDGDCLAVGTCIDGYHDGGDGACVTVGTCAQGYLDGGGGECVLPGNCASGYHDGGDGVCLPEGTCADGYHDGGDGACQAVGSCSPGFHDGGGGDCLAEGVCADGYHDGGDGACQPAGSCSPGFHDGGGDSGLCLPEGQCLVGYEPGPDGVCIPSVLMLEDDFEDGVIDPIWNLWRMEFEESGGCLNSVSQPRIGFDYGHTGHGRGAWVNAQIGNPYWTDFRLTVEVENGPPGQFNPHGVSSCYRGSVIQFRLATAEESWNEPEETTYRFSMQTGDCPEWSTHGKWSLSRRHGYWIDAPSGWNELDEMGSGKGLASGTDPDIFTAGLNLIEIEIVGDRIQVWVNGHQLADHTESPEDYGADQSPILFGGVGVRWGWESTGRVCSLLVERAGL